MRKVLALREGSIIVVTIVTIIYFAATVERLPHRHQLQEPAAVLLLPGDHGRRRGVRDDPRRDRPIDWGALPDHPVRLLEAHHGRDTARSGVILALAIAGVLGSVNGFFTAYVGIPSFVVTLAMLFFLDGLALIISHSQQISTPGTSVTTTSTFASVFGGGTYAELIWAVVLVVILQIVLSFTRWGVYTVATGGNRLGAAEAGIRTRVVIVRNFMLCAMTAGLAGVLEAVRTSSMTPDPSGSNQNLLYAVAAVIIGGTLMTGGEGTVVGALLERCSWASSRTA